MVRQFRGAVVLFAALQAPGAGAEAPAKEVEHLLRFVETSGCIFERNGKRHEPAEARAHIERKYRHLRNRISTSEEFIRYAASESSFTGQAYHVECDGGQQLARLWLTDELARFRRGSP